MNIIQAHTKELERACWLSRVKELYVFGSVLPISSIQKDIKTKRAVERNIEIIGEAMSPIIKVLPYI